MQDQSSDLCLFRGNGGHHEAVWSSGQVIETSHILFHIWNHGYREQLLSVRKGGQSSHVGIFANQTYLYGMGTPSMSAGLETPKIAPADVIYPSWKFWTRLPVGATSQMLDFEDLYQRPAEEDANETLGEVHQDIWHRGRFLSVGPKTGDQQGHMYYEKELLQVQHGLQKINRILCYVWLPEGSRWHYLARSGLPTVSCKKNFNFWCSLTHII